MSRSLAFFSSPRNVFAAAALMRLLFFSYGLLQDAFSPVKYTDIDYYVFTDAARFVRHGRSPYDRDTYRYTPLLSWLLLPAVSTAWSFSFGKALFAIGDLVAGALIVKVLRRDGMREERALKFASIWLLNPMVGQISTRGSSEGLLGVLVVALLWAVTRRRIVTAGVILGLAVHFKIYPFIYAPSIIWWMDEDRLSDTPKDAPQKPVSKRKITADKTTLQKITEFANLARITLTLASLSTFMALNLLMYMIYGAPFIKHTYLHHITRIDHRHNFSIYNTLLYLKSSTALRGSSSLALESIAFLPQLLLSAVALPLALAKRDLPSTMLAQTFAFVTFNKVCTSQYFLWYMIFLPFYLPRSSLLNQPRLGFVAISLWIVGQAAWLQQGFQLEFVGESTFIPGLWLASVVFFLVNVWLLGVIVRDVGMKQEGAEGLLEESNS